MPLQLLPLLKAVILSARGPTRFLQRGGGKRRICFWSPVGGRYPSQQLLSNHRLCPVHRRSIAM